MPTGRAPQPNFNRQATAAAAATAAQTAAQPTGTLLGWARKFLQAQANVPTAGQWTANLPPPPPGQAYLVELITLNSTSSSASTASVQVDGQEVDFSTAANHDQGAELPPVYVAPGSQFSVIWSNVASGAVCTANVQYRAVVP